MISLADAERLLLLVRSNEAVEADLLLQSLVTPNGPKILKDIESLLNEMVNDKSLVLEDIQGELANVASFRCQNAVEQLEFISRECSKAANETLKSAELIIEQLALFDNLSDEQNKIVVLINDKLIDIVVGQSYQDLSEQVNGKLVTFLKNLEKNLAQIVDLNKASSIDHEMGPSVTSFEKVDSVELQSDVDDILNSVGN